MRSSLGVRSTPLYAPTRSARNVSMVTSTKWRAANGGRDREHDSVPQSAASSAATNVRDRRRGNTAAIVCAEVNGCNVVVNALTPWSTAVIHAQVQVLSPQRRRSQTREHAHHEFSRSSRPLRPPAPDDSPARAADDG